MKETTPFLPPNVESVQVDSLVLMKIVKHFESERALGGTPMIRGYLTGLIATEDKRLELTNCFQCTTGARGADQGEEEVQRHQDEVSSPLTLIRGYLTGLIATEDKRLELTNCFQCTTGARGADQGEEEVQRHQDETQEMLRRFRNMNMDYQLLGFYESASFGSAFNEYLVVSMFEYQSLIEDSVVLIYDNTKTAMGLLALRAYRLSPSAMDRCHTEFTPDTVREMGVTFSNMLEELPIHVKNSHLVNVALAEMQLLRSKQAKAPFLDLSHSGGMEKCIRALMLHLDELNMETGRYNKYAATRQKLDAIRDTHLQKRKLENEGRRARGEPEMGLDDILKGKQPPSHPMLDTFLAAKEVQGHLDHALQVSAQNLGKLFLTEAVVEEKEGKLRDRAASLADK